MHLFKQREFRKKIIQLNGDNVFLSEAKGRISSGIRNNFFETANRNTRKDVRKLTFEEGLIGLKGKHMNVMLMTIENEEPVIESVYASNLITASNNTLEGAPADTQQVLNGIYNNDGIEIGIGATNINEENIHKIVI